MAMTSLKNNLPRRMIRRTLFLLFGVLGFFAMGHIYSKAESGTSRSSVQPVQIAKATIYSALSATQELDPRPDSRAESSSPIRMLVWTQSLYLNARLNHKTAAQIIKMNRAESLEFRLSKRWKDLLRAHIASKDSVLRDISLLVSDEQDEMKRLLKNTPKRIVLLSDSDRRGSPQYKKLLKLQEKLERTKEGLVWGDAVKPGSTNYIYFIVRFAEWPGYKRLIDEQRILIYNRILEVRRWISQSFAKNGMGLFENN